MTIVGTVKRERSFVGQLFKWAFIGFNFLMIVWISGGVLSASRIQTHSPLEQIGTTIGATIGVTLLVILWALGDLILGILVLLTRGNRVIIEESSSSFAPRGWSVADEGPAFDLARVDQRIAELKAEAPPSPRSVMASPSPQGFGKRRA
jgi:hypothetical protein